MCKLLFVLFVAGALAAQTPGRVEKNLNAGWVFQRQAHGTGELGSFDRENAVAAQVEPRFKNATDPVYDDSWWQRVNIPHTWNAQDSTDDEPGYWRGIGWYRKHFRLEPGITNRRIFLEFDGVNQVAEFWLNGAYLGRHTGGYTSFEYDITRQARAGGTTS